MRGDEPLAFGEVVRVLILPAGGELARGRMEAIRAEARRAGVGRRPAGPRRRMRRALGVRLVSAGLRLIGAGAGSQLRAVGPQLTERGVR